MEGVWGGRGKRVDSFFNTKKKKREMELEHFDRARSSMRPARPSIQVFAFEKSPTILYTYSGVWGLSIPERLNCRANSVSVVFDF